jgi:hypothetical protein
VAITVTVAGTAGTNGSGVLSLSTSAYNQAAGNCIYVCCNCYSPGATTFAISDTAGNSYGSPVLSVNGGNSNLIQVWAITNCLGSAFNAVLVTLSSFPSYATLTYYDISGTTFLDIQVSATTVTSGSSISKTVSTNGSYPNQAIISTMFQDSAGLSSATAPTGFTAGLVINSYSLTGYNTYTTTQTGLALTWSNISPTANFDMVVVSFGAAAAGVTPLHLLTMMGVGT